MIVPNFCIDRLHVNLVEFLIRRFQCCEITLLTISKSIDSEVVTLNNIETQLLVKTDISRLEEKLLWQSNDTII